MCLLLYFTIYVVTMVHLLLQEEVEQLMKAAEDGDIPTLVILIQDKKIHVDTRGPWEWVSCQYTNMYKVQKYDLLYQELIVSKYY